MGDSETVVTQTPTIVGYASAGYTSTGYADGNSNVTDSGALPSEATGEISTSEVPDGSGVVDGSAYGLGQESHVATTEKSGFGLVDHSGNVSAYGNESMESSQVAGYDSSATANGTAVAGSGIPVENVDASDNMGGAVDEHQYLDNSALSVEEERLWNIVRANSLDFNAWTALIEETEKVAEDNISKIRKVYDAFLAEFPLCYGYWKKYADHEARLGSIEKVVEVYERAVQGVTYSVDIWLHYCIFAINTYGDPDTVRRSRPVKG